MTVVPYDPDWPRQYESERMILGNVFDFTRVRIEHIGSTAVPDLGGKPIIDIMIGVSKLAVVERCIPSLATHGYEYVKEYEAQLPERRYFRKPRVGTRLFHVHCVVQESDFWIRHLAFRDYLRAHPDSAAAYYELKRKLSASVRKSEYTDAKSPFIEGILSRLV